MIRQRRLPLIILLLTLSAPILRANDDYRSFLALGDSHYRNFDPRGALEAYRQAYAMAPTEFEAIVRMVRVHNDIGRSMLWRNDSAEVWYERAVEYAEELVQHHPERAETYFWHALARGSLVPFRGVSEKLDIGKFVVSQSLKAIAMDSTFAPPYVLLGILYREAARLKWYERVVANVVFGGSLPGTIEDSERVLERALALDPDDIFAHVELARTHRFLGDHERAAELLRAALTLEPRSQRERNEQAMAERILSGRGRER